jgi:lipid-A-disaccharide synthase
MNMRIGIVVGEVSGETLAVGLIQSLKQYYPNLSFEGVLGPRLIQAGGHALYSMERLSVMGLVEPLARLPELWKMRRYLIQHFIHHNPPDIFIGIDAPDFNLGLERKLKEAGIPVVHYVSPSVWAWRQGRIHGIKKSVDLMLTLLPFEAKFYQQHQVPVCFTGHPLADQIPLEISTENARTQLNLLRGDPTKKGSSVIAILPGSRNSELKYLAEVFLQTAKLCFSKNPNLQFVAPLVSEAHKIRFSQLKQLIAPELPMQIRVGNARTAIAAADAVLVASGTATLEVMLHKKPMVVAYRMHPITYQIAKRLVKVPYVALPNLLAEAFVVPEFIQEKANPEQLSQAILDSIHPSFDKESLLKKFNELHLILKRNASDIAANAIVEMGLR